MLATVWAYAVAQLHSAVGPNDVYVVAPMPDVASYCVTCKAVSVVAYCGISLRWALIARLVLHV